MRWFAAAVALAVALGPVAASANEPLTFDQAIRRLRACASAGATNAPHADLRAAVIAVRSLCRPQIDRVYAKLDARIAAQNRGASDDYLAELRAKAHRAIDDELVALIATQTGLSR